MYFLKYFIFTAGLFSLQAHSAENSQPSADNYYYAMYRCLSAESFGVSGAQEDLDLIKTIDRKTLLEVQNLAQKDLPVVKAFANIKYKDTEKEEKILIKILELSKRALETVLDS